VKESDNEWKQFNKEITFNVKEKEQPKPSDYIKVPFKEALNLVSTR